MQIQYLIGQAIIILALYGNGRDVLSMATAIESMTGVNISSAYFTNAMTFQFFPKHPKPPRNNRVALLYGKNGSGKSTIAQGFREYRDSVIPRTVTLTPVDGVTQIKISPSGKPEKFFIFDEEYVSSRVRIRGSGLDAIVLFGEQVTLEEQIAEIEKQLDAKKLEISQQETECARFANTVMSTPLNTGSSKFAINCERLMDGQQLAQKSRDNGKTFLLPI